MTKYFYSFIVVWVMVIANFAHANESGVLSNIEKGLKDSGHGIYSDTTSGTSMSSYIGTIIQAFISILGVIFIVMVILDGYNYFMARDDANKAKEALGSIRRAIIGLIIILGAWAITRFVFGGLGIFSSDADHNSFNMP